MNKVRADEITEGQTVKGNLISGEHVVAKIGFDGIQMRSATAKTVSFFNEQGEEFFVGRVYAKATVVE